MKRAVAVVLAVLLLTGCGSTDAQMDRALALREKILKSSGCSFDTVITADYGEKLYTFRMDCQTDTSGNLSFTVTDPQTIAGVTGRIASDGGALTFDDQVLGFELLADGQITPVSAPWLLMRTLRSGYLRSCTMDEDTLRITIDDSYADDALQLDIWLDGDDLPKQAEILWQGRRIVSLEVQNFSCV